MGDGERIRDTETDGRGVELRDVEAGDDGEEGGAKDDEDAEELEPQREPSVDGDRRKVGFLVEIDFALVLFDESFADTVRADRRHTR